MHTYRRICLAWQMSNNLFVSARYAVKTVPDKLLNLRNENARNKFTQKTLLRNDHMTINLQSTSNTTPRFNA